MLSLIAWLCGRHGNAGATLIKIGIVGFGYWGPKLFRCFQSLEEAEFSWICDKDIARGHEVSEVYHLPFFSDLQQALQNPPDILIVSSPPSEHFSAARAGFGAGCHVLLEKPAVLSYGELQSLVELSSQRNLKLGVDHTFLFSPHVRAIKQMVAQGALGDILSFESWRFNFGPIRRDVSALHDLAVHDISMALYVLGEPIASISAQGRSDVRNEPENNVQIRAYSERGTEICIQADWLYPVKSRRLFIKGTKAMLMWDDTGLRIFPKSVSNDNDALIIVDNGSKLIDVPDVEPLKIMAQEFLDYLQGQPFVSDIHVSLAIQAILDAAFCSMNEDGCKVSVNYQEPPCP